MLAGDIVDTLDFEERSNINASHHHGVEAEDSLPFSKTGVVEGTISFGRFPYKMYHRGGVTIDDGDTMDVLDNSSFEIESEVVASIALHLTVDSEHKFENQSMVPYDSSGDGNNDSVKAYYNLTTDTNTTLLSRVRLGIYNSSSDAEMISTVSGLYPLKKNNYEDGMLTISLPYDFPSDDYTVRLTVMDYWLDVDDEYNETVYLHPYSKPKSDFDTHTSSLKARTFIDNSTPSPDASIVNWTWNFGDGNYSYQQNTSHTYYDDGNYTVSLTILDSDSNSNTTNKTIVVDNAIPNAIINISSNIQIAGNSVSFNSSSTDSDGSITNYTWDFGDETTDYTASSTHTYSNSGIYSVNLTITDDDGGINYTTKTMIVAGALADDSYQQDDPQNHSWDTVQEAINDVNDDDIIYVYNGNYSESLTINRSISLYGEDCKKVKIQSLGTVIDIVNESVNSQAF
jgi:PKD repeat protein